MSTKSHKIKWLGSEITLEKDYKRDPLFLLFLYQIEFAEIHFSTGKHEIEKLHKNYSVVFDDDVKNQLISAINDHQHNTNVK